MRGEAKKRKKGPDGQRIRIRVRIRIRGKN